MEFIRKRRVKRLVRRLNETQDPEHKYSIVMNEFEKGKLYAKSGYKITNPKQARAVAYSYSQRYGRKKKNFKEQPKPKLSFLGKLKNILLRRRKDAKQNKV